MKRVFPIFQYICYAISVAFLLMTIRFSLADHGLSVGRFIADVVVGSAALVFMPLVLAVIGMWKDR